MHRRRLLLALATAAVTATGLAQVAPATGADPHGGPPPGVTASQKLAASSLGNGLGRLLAQSGADGQRRHLGAGGLTIDQTALAIRDRRGRVLVDLTPREGVDRTAFRREATSLGLDVTAVDHDLGTLEGYVRLTAVQDLAGLAGTGTIAQAIKPQVHTGSVTSQGVVFQRVDKLLAQGIDGAGITVGVLSDSYDTATLGYDGNPVATHAADDVASGDLPGVGNPDHPDPVVVIEDSEQPEHDEGRAMLQIIHDMAPAAKLCFATAFNGMVGFADNIRALADPAGPCAADVIVDDIGYGDESPYSDNVVSDAVDDVTSDGVAYFSAAGNAGDHQAWSSKVNLVSAKAGLPGTNLDFTDVDPALYAGGLQDMQTGPGVDVAQNIALDPDDGATFMLQWEDPYDLNGAELGDPFLSETGEITEADPEPTFEFTPTADQLGSDILVVADAIPSGETDLILTVIKPDGTTVGPIDTISSPEQAATTLDQTGTYSIIVSGFDGDTGDFTLDVLPVLSPSSVTTDFNVLLFGPDGTYYGVAGEDNTLSGRPSEIAGLYGVGSEVQLVIARRTTGKTPVTRMSYVMWGAGYVAEHAQPAPLSITGHPAAAGAVAVAAYDPFAPYLPESYTSAGGRMAVSFDSAGHAYAKPQVRAKPEVASTDGGNTTFFVSDSSQDDDTWPNFYGTSAAAPHAAAIAALMLSHAGGPGTLTPAQITKRMQRSAFTHDLDPNRASGSVKGLKLTAVGGQDDERNLTPGSVADTSFFRIAYRGKKTLKSITLDGRTASPTALGHGILFDTRPLGEPGAYDEGGFPFQVGSTSGGLKKADVHAAFKDKVADGRFQTLTLKFKHGLHKGQRLTFGIDRDLVVPAAGVPSIAGNGADELGGAAVLPSGRVRTGGMVFSAKGHGVRLEGRMRNRLGSGWTHVDGFGVVNAEQAVLGR